MTVTTTATKAFAFTNGAQTVFNYGFTIPTKAMSALYAITTATGAYALISPSAWSLQPNGDLFGGTFTYPLSPSPALPAGTTLMLVRLAPYTQTTKLGNQGPLFQKSVEQALDEIDLQVQQLSEAITRAFQYPITEGSQTATVPAFGARPNTLLGFDSVGALTLFASGGESPGGPFLPLAGGTLAGALEIVTGGLNVDSGDVLINDNLGIMGDLVVEGNVLFTGAVSGIGYDDLPSELSNIPVAIPYTGKPPAGTLGRVVMPIVQTSVLPANMVATRSNWITLATAPSVFIVSEQAVTGGTLTVLGNITIQASGSVTLPTMAAVTLTAGTALVLDPPSSQDATLADGAITFMLKRV